MIDRSQSVQQQRPTRFRMPTACWGGNKRSQARALLEA